MKKNLEQQEKFNRLLEQNSFHKIALQEKENEMNSMKDKIEQVDHTTSVIASLRKELDNVKALLSKKTEDLNENQRSLSSYTAVSLTYIHDT